MNTTISKAAQSAELLAASILINELCKKVDAVGNQPVFPSAQFDVIVQYREMIDTLANVVTSTYEPAES